MAEPAAAVATVDWELRGVRGAPAEQGAKEVGVTSKW